MRAPRAATWERLAGGTFDLLVIGAGIVGSRIAYEAAGAGLTVALVDAGDFGGATSSGSSKLIHGGFRYLPMGDIGLVWESQRERKALLGRVAPNLVRRMPMVLAAYRGGPKGPAMATAGVLAYGALCGFRGTGVSLLGARGAQQLVPSLRTEGLSVCGLFDEGQTNDSRLVLATVAGAIDRGTTAVNHARVIDLAFREGMQSTATIMGGVDEGVVEVGFRNVVNAAGPWVDKVRLLEDPTCAPIARLSKGVHLLLKPESEWHAGLAVPVDGGRVAMAIPWQGMLLLGTTDTDYAGDPADCCVSPEDVAQVLEEASLALPAGMLRTDAVRFSFAGLRVLPLGQGTTANAHREHLVRSGRHGMVSIAGGKLTTHRRIALDVLQRLRDPRASGLRLVDTPLPQARSGRVELIGGGIDPRVVTHVTGIYGSDSLDVLGQRWLHSNALERIHPDGPDVWAQAYHAVDHEWATTVEDVVRRRTTIAVRGLATPAVRAELAQLVASSTGVSGYRAADGSQIGKR
ncbi:MAG TPA: glycerol-3-phosphate dehydrogenase/oxidase [Candidatus Dormibacteraeota bacterium]|nr:glycerol-3-phosphate dehydrogenase/oxidase [Candidatus Dormibacteraeota bacterium]